MRFVFFGVHPDTQKTKHTTAFSVQSGTTQITIFALLFSRIFQVFFDKCDFHQKTHERMNNEQASRCLNKFQFFN